MKRPTKKFKKLTYLYFAAAHTKSHALAIAMHERSSGYNARIEHHKRNLNYPYVVWVRKKKG